ncbi:MAG: hypothetical protein P9L96_05600 [Candidatus Gygaella obscura]|nr:hypothetical protein [Candidatus Gygaella obscura]
MFANIIGWLLIIWGILFIMKPEFLRKKLQKKSQKTIKKIILGITVSFSVLIIIAAFKTEGMVSKILAVLAIIAVIKAFLMVKSKVSDKLIEWYMKLSVKVLVLGGAMQVLIGVSILVVNK